MDEKLVKYILDLNNSTMNIKTYPIICEGSLLNSKENPTLKDKLYYCKSFKIEKSLLNKINEHNISNQVYIVCIDDGTNTIQNEQMVKELFTDYINNRQKDNEKRYYEETSRNNNCLHAIKDAFVKPKDFIDEIESQAINCMEMLFNCDCIDNLRRLSKKGYENQLMVDVDNNGLLPLKEAINLNCIVDDYNICRVQLENYGNLGAVLYNYEEDKMYFSVFKGDDEYAIIEDTTLETLREDYQAYLDKINERDIDERRDSMLNLMKKMTNARTTSYFRDYAIAEIKIAYRLKEYLDADEMFPPKDLNNVTKVLLENSEYEEAIRRIMDKELYIDLGCSSGYESLVEEAVEFAKNLVMKKNLENNEEKYDMER